MVHYTDLEPEPLRDPDISKERTEHEKWKSKLEARFRTCLSQTGAKLTSNLDMDREAPPIAGKILENALASTLSCTQRPHARMRGRSKLLFLFNFIMAQYPGSELAPRSHFDIACGLGIVGTAPELARIGIELAPELA